MALPKLLPGVRPVSDGPCLTSKMISVMESATCPWQGSDLSRSHVEKFIKGKFSERSSIVGRKQVIFISLEI